MEFFKYITPSIYLLLVIIWSYILYFYLRKIYKRKGEDKLILTLLVVLAIDAFRTLFESAVFGARHSSQTGIIPIEVYNFLAQQHIVFIPKVINLLASLLILFILIKKWIPAETSRQIEQMNMIKQRTIDLEKNIVHLNETKNDLEEQKQLFEIMYNTIPDCVLITDTKRKIILVNKGLRSTFGYQPGELIGKTTELLLSHNCKPHDSNKINQDENFQGTEHFHLIHYKTKDKLEFPGETFEEKLFDNEGLLKGYLIIIRNVSERVEFINEINSQKHKAMEADRLKSAFLSNMSHELRTPMNGIVGFTDLIQQPDLTSEERKEYIQIIKQSSDRILGTINNIIEISKIETDQIEVNLNPVNVGETLNYLHKFFNPQAEKKHLQLIVENELFSDQNCITTDGYKLNSILTNLIKNAIKYSKQGSIIIKCEKDNQQLLFSIKDSGIGIEEDRKEAIFDRFVQADIEDRAVYEGSGLGLSISKSYVEILGGKIWLESISGKGSTFYFSIPINQ